jgi:hypothetical protein
MMMHKYKRTNKSKKEIFLGRYIFPATSQGTVYEDGGTPEDTSSPPSAPAVAAETDAEAWLGDPGRSYAS